MELKYKIEERKGDHNTIYYASFVRIGWIFKRWSQIGLHDTHEDAKKHLKFISTPRHGPWYYSEDDMRDL